LLWCRKSSLYFCVVNVFLWRILNLKSTLYCFGVEFNSCWERFIICLQNVPQFPLYKRSKYKLKELNIFEFRFWKYLTILVETLKYFKELSYKKLQGCSLKMCKKLCQELGITSAFYKMEIFLLCNHTHIFSRANVNEMWVELSIFILDWGKKWVIYRPLFVLFIIII